MSPITPLFYLLLVLTISTTPTPATSSNLDDTFYEVLKAHGLPMGLLPKGVKEFKIDETGRFEVHLDQACNAKFESELHYDRNVSGTLIYGQIGALSGISAQELFLWFPVKGIRVDTPGSGLIYFDVGILLKQFSLSLFETPKECMAARDLEIEAVENGKLIADAVLKSQSRELRYQLHQDSPGSVITV